MPLDGSKYFSNSNWTPFLGLEATLTSKVSLHQHVSVLNCVLESWLVMVANTRSHEFIHIL